MQPRGELTIAIEIQLPSRGLQPFHLIPFEMLAHNIIRILVSLCSFTGKSRLIDTRPNPVLKVEFLIAAISPMDQFPPLNSVVACEKDRRNRHHSHDLPL